MTERKRLVKEGDQYWDPESGYIYNDEGEVIARDAIYRPEPKPKINFDEYDIDDFKPRQHNVIYAQDVDSCTIVPVENETNTLAVIDWDGDGKWIMEQRIKRNKFEYVSWSKREFDLPTRATRGSAGYDFYSPVDTIIQPGETVRFSLEVKVQLEDWTFLMIVPRSSLGFKDNNHVSLTNTTGIIDQDYYNNPDNEGVIELRLHNFGTEPFVIHKNDRLVQGIFVNYGITCDDSAEDIRISGLGSTGN